MNFFKKLFVHIILISTWMLVASAALAQFTISGTINTETGEPLVNVPVYLGGVESSVVLTDENGDYQFSVQDIIGSNYTIEPYSNANPLNGVSTLDWVMITNHIYDNMLLDSPYKIIAADVDLSGAVNMTDTMVLRQLILGQIQEFPSTPSWKFVTADFIFPDPANPLSSNFPTIYSVNGIQGDVIDIDFIGVKTGDVNGTAFTTLNVNPCDYSCGTIAGNIYYDLNENCASDVGEQGMQHWVITATSNDHTFYGSTDELGNYIMSVYPDDYTVTVSTPNALWSLCQNDQAVTVIVDNESTAGFAVNAVEDCAAMEVDIGTPFLRRCFESQYVIDYCNQGTITAMDASVEVTFDSFLTVISTSAPWSSQVGNTYIFELGDIAVGECGSINVLLDVSCDSELGETLCSEAHIFPDSICGPLPDLWDGSNIGLIGQCDGDSVQFFVINVGDPMTEAVNYLVIEDDMIMMTGDNDMIQLGTAESRSFAFPANGSTWRLEVNQSPNHPLNEMISAAIEGCGVNGDGEFSTGFITQFPQLTPSNAVDVDCVQNIGAYDPNDKSAIPVGHDDEHFIERNVDLDYRIRFQNTGTDTAFTVVIRDTLSEWLDVSSIDLGPASHAYDFKLEGEGVAVFTFSNIMLPDSNVNEAASHGFVKFNIAQLEDNPLGTVIENEAAIYFDFNEPVITNTVFHTIGEDFLDILDNIIAEPGQHFDIKLYPNLVAESATLQLEGMDLNDGTFLLYDLYGRLLRSQRFDGNALEFYKNELTSGMYLFEIQERGQHLSSGKLMIR